jgi:hypothetical protein
MRLNVVSSKLSRGDEKLFSVIEDAWVILRNKGVYKQTKVFQYKGGLYARHGSGFIRLMRAHKATSVPDILWEDLYLPFEPVADKLGRLMVSEER